jgi:membrane protease YdiL (CAAX protease family)
MTWGFSNNRIRQLIETSLVLTGVYIFALFIHGGPAQRVAALAALSAAAVVISLSISDLQSLLKYLGLSEFSRKIAVYSLAGLGLGILLALRCRRISNMALLPRTLTMIALIAPMIGITEELLFRGFLQGKLSGINIYAAILLSAFGHTLYKYLVLRSFPVDIGIDFLSLVVFTFIAGLMCGALRALSKSIIPACVTHSVFDILVYGGLSTWPVWVWK